ncbi:PASTA domain-containing protein [Dethiobacter alkaliphilus]|uniref:quinate 5-dehydrogenase n=1 Tax=Dethiobacter alkaliphilus TaxID=427926 RepID=UPI00222610C1|nr:quinate 5-dehydrogenase [Dethiobacter alkaliphilus]MCW3491671.1 quinate 5-dehydrogenase [Dethiobacter alkaliphilus]
MKQVISISLGSSKRNHAVEVEMAGELCRVERIGTDGDMVKMVEMISRLDGKVDAFGLGGMDLYVYAGQTRYTLRDAKNVVRAAKLSPIVDGSGLKNTLERKVIEYLLEQTEILNENTKVLMMSGADRFGMAQALDAAGCRLTLGDLVFTVGIPVPLRSLQALEKVARLLAPFICQLPLSMLYPTGKKQEENKPKASGLFAEADVIAGDFHFIRRYMPENMKNKTIITNTTTSDDVALLKERGVETLITTTPELNGRSFGTNVMEALLVALSGKDRELDSGEYEALLDAVNFVPRITNLNEV